MATVTSNSAGEEGVANAGSASGTLMNAGAAAPSSPLPAPPAPPPEPIEPPTLADGVKKAPGILDRRKSTRPSSAKGDRSLSRGSTRSRRGPPIKITMADIGSEVKAVDGETPGDEASDAFEDAQDSTPRPTPTESDVNGLAAKREEVTGLGINGDGMTEDHQSTVQSDDESRPKMSARMSSFGEDQGLEFAIDGADSEPSHSRNATLDTVPNLPAPGNQQRQRSVSPGKFTSGRQSPTRQLHGLSGDFSVNAQPPPSTADRRHALEQRQLGDRSGAMSPPQPGLARKASSGFAGLLGRMGSIRKARSPPAPRQESRFAAERRNTAASMASMDTSTNGLSSIADGDETAHLKPSLQDQFQNLRRQEEFPTHETSEQDNSGHANRPSMGRTQSDAEFGSPTLSNGEDQPRMSRALSTPGLLKSPVPSPSLPPGTASGMSAGPSEEPHPVNWDLWQQVVYEGSAAVQRTSGEELNRAIASGIPPAIRGVVWQVLADSKSEELENMYRTLKARGTDVEPSRPAPMSRTASQSGTSGPIVEKGSVSSSRSSTHSASSTPATSAMESSPPSIEGNGSDIHSKLLAEKQRRESASLAKLEKAIKRDMGSRTSYSKYTQSAGLQDGLFGVCKAYALFDEGVGYAQGMNFIAMPLLFNMSEEEAFALMVRLMSKYDVRSLFTANMAGLHLRLYQFERLLEDHDPTLYCHLKRRNVGPQLYATQWFLTLFAYRFPLQLVLRVYDLILSEGLTAILKFGIVLMQRNRDALLEMEDMSSLTTFLKEKLFDVYIDKSPSASSLLDSGFFGSVTGGADKELYRADEMVRDACDITIADETLARYTAEWEESQGQERERTEELETLRTSTATLTLKVRRLEEQTQQQDSEHVTIASDLVRLKVENDMLHDDNEGFKMKVEELQRLVDGQPAEVEEKLKEEMDRIMQRNIEVQNENRMLKEEAEEMEQALVQVKMLHAQTQSDYDTLRQKWSNLQSMLNGK